MSRIYLFLACLLSCTVLRGHNAHFYPSDLFSSSLINDLVQDRMGSIWIGTDYGLNRFDGYHFQTFLHDDADSTTLCANAVTSMLCDREGRLWVGTNKGLDLYDAARETFRHYPFPSGVRPRVSSIVHLKDGSLVVGTAGYGAFILQSPEDRLEVFSVQGVDGFYHNIYEDSRGRLWKSGFDDAIYMRQGKTMKRYQSVKGYPLGFVEHDGQLWVPAMHGLQVFADGQFVPAQVDMSAVAGKDVIFSFLSTDKDGNIYIGTRGHGLFRLVGRRLEHVEASVKGINYATAKISAILFDRDGNLWLGCHRKGLLMVPQRPMQFGNWSFDEQGIALGSNISSVCEGDGGIVWTSVQGVGVYGFNQQGHVVAHPKAPDAVEFIFRDRLRRYWVGTDDGLFAYDPLTGASQQRVTFDCDMFNDMTSDAQGRIYISTFSRGFCVFDPQTGKLLNHNFYEAMDSVRGRLCNNWIMGLSPSADGLIWMATASGVSCYDPSADSFRSQGWNELLADMLCFDVCELHGGRLPDGRSLSGAIIIGTERGLYLYDRAKRTTEPFPGSEQLRDKAISYIVQANDGDIWCSTSNGIWQYKQADHTFIGHIGGNGLSQREYLYGVGMHTDDDIVYFAHNDGLTVFSPRSITDTDDTALPLQLTAFRVGDQYVRQGTVINGVEVTDRAIDQSNYFTLSYLDHTITMAFSQFVFVGQENLLLEYRINDGEWIANPEGKNEYTLGHLQPGTYRIATRARLGDDYSKEKVVVVTVRAPWYRTTTAYFIYFVLLAAFVYFMQRNYRRRTSEQLNEEKMKFLINATHDIRSPLTLILAALKKLEPGAATETIEHNSKRILNLVNQILDVRKIDKQQMHLHCQQTDMVAFARGIYKMFEFNAKERNIQFVFDADDERIDAWVDRSQFDKVVSNLLTNAFKYSYDSGEVRLTLRHTADTFVLEVLDNGVGIDADSLKHIFDRFYQGSNQRNLNIDGTGIGLNLCKMIVDMHHGTITARQRSDGQRGSLFTVTLPLGNSHLRPEEIEAPKPADDSTQTPAGNSAPTGGSGHKHYVLIVDDDLEIGRYIQSELGHYYKFGLCPNGKEGLKELLTGSGYDLVISDVMMPEMDGFTMLRMIKTNMNLSHLPVIMLTSKADVGNRLEGLERGADAFLAKPFDMQELHLTIDNLIQTRHRLKGKFTGAQQQADKVEMPEVKGNDEQLMERIMKAINKNLSDSDFNVEMLTQEVGISRAQLHRKMKEMTGISTSEFIRNIRLEQAARLLKEQKINVTQVAYTVGFSNLAHFSTIFRKHFGVAPSEYAEQGQN